MPPSYSPDQFAALLEMQDLGGMEEEMARQQALSQQLRSSALRPSAGKDWASQLARGIQGGMAGYSMAQEKPMMSKYSLAKKDALGRAKKSLFPDAAGTAGIGASTGLMEVE